MATIILMFAGIVLGLLILVSLPEGDKKLELSSILDHSKQEISIEQRKRSLQQLLQVWKLQHSIRRLMNKKRLSGKDSLEIKTIDRQLNQLIHD